ncbi:DUF805 domain-containing protein [Aquiflexum sp.]|uniref:DUF805 domain-containing protein n=1 Tax=Aquiflexum sp. TaxID=1872584 RepID=UPI0035937AF2
MKSIFNPKGRITRRKYLTLFLIFYSINVLSLMMIFQSFQSNEWIAFWAFSISLISSIILLMVQAIRRLHDLGYNWMYSLYLLIPPPINFVGFIWLAWAEGQNGENMYGPDPRRTDLI